MSQITDIADALVADLNTEMSGLGATREYTVDLDRKDLTAQVVYVVPTAERDGVASRFGNEREFDLQVVVLAPVTLGDSAGKDDMDSAMGNVDAIKALFTEDGELRDESQSGATWIGMTHEPTVWADRESTDPAFMSSQDSARCHRVLST